MPDEPQSQEPVTPPPPSEAVIGNYATARRAHEAGLAALAAGHPYRVEAVEGRYLLLVDQRNASLLRREVAMSEHTNRFWPPSALPLPDAAVSKAPTVCAGLALVAAHGAATQLPQLRELGINSSSAVLEGGQHWRLITAITLHADLSHLAGNLLGLSLFAYFACRYLGNGLAWLLILLTAALSNLTTALLQADSDYRSLGASTAVFAALGLLAGFPFGCFLRTRHPLVTRDWLLPFFGSCVFFAWMGGGDFPTDVGAHLWSFVYGSVVASLAAASGLPRRLPTAIQPMLLLTSACLAIGSWVWAVRYPAAP